MRDPRMTEAQAKAKELEMIAKACESALWTFATKKIGHGNCVLLAKKKYSFEKYRYVCKEGYVVKFRTKASAHVAAKSICEFGLEDSFYELGEPYEE